MRNTNEKRKKKKNGGSYTSLNLNRRIGQPTCKQFKYVCLSYMTVQIIIFKFLYFIETPLTFAHKRQIFETGSNMSLHVTVTVAIAMVCVVHAQLFPRINIVVEVPPGFLAANKVEIFVNEDNNNDVDTLRYNGSEITIYGEIKTKSSKCLI